MPANYIPAADADFDNWLVNFDTLLTADPTAYGETGGTAAAVAAVTATWVAAFALATDPSTRTSPTVAAKDAARYTAEQTVRPVAIRIRNNSAVTNAQRVDLGITVPKVVPTPIPAPTSAAALALTNATPLVHLLQYSDTILPDGKAKPYGVIGLEIFRSIGVVPATDPAQCTYYGTATKSPFRSTFASDDRGKICTYFGRWTTRSGPGGMSQSGPWSAALDAHVI